MSKSVITAVRHPNDASKNKIDGINAYYRSISNSRGNVPDAYNKSIPSLPKIKNYNPNFANGNSSPLQ